MKGCRRKAAKAELVDEEEPPTLRRPRVVVDELPSCEGTVRDVGWLRGFTTGRTVPIADDWRWLAVQVVPMRARNAEEETHEAAAQRPRDREVFAAGMAEGAAEQGGLRR